MKACPPAEQLLGLLAEELDECDRGAVETHVEGCAACQRALEGLSPPPLGRPPDRGESGYEPRSAFLRRLKVAPPQPPAGPGVGGGPEEALPRELGDFRLLREVGRGGMGVVYEAEQRSLGRRVAVKVLPFAATLDPRQLQRFHNEAQAAACLHHPHIVPVHFVGCERGVHFYAMQFVDGQTLAALIDDRRRQAPAPATEAARGTPHPPSLPAGSFVRAVARLGIQAALALEHAHAVGVIHRDVKPSNLLVDGRGDLWVTDFGLAQSHGRGELTMTGDLVGTLRYMSPEQALGRHGPLDHRSDVYSLGVTLYEALTLEPAVNGTGRDEVLRQIALEEPRPPRRLNRALPADLETIVLKAMAQEPAERYATAGELADDLGRFLEDRPVRARRPTWARRLRKWAWRHRAAVATGVVSSIVLLAGAVAALTISNVRITQETIQKDEALRQSRASEETATRRLRQALQAVDRMLTRVADGPLPDTPQTHRARQALYEDALEFYQRLLPESSSDPALRLETALAYARVGDIRSDMSQFTEAEDAYRRGIALANDLVAEVAREPAYRRALAWCRRGYGACLQKRGGRSEEAGREIRASLELWLGLADEAPADPDHRFHVALCRRLLGLCLSETGRAAEAEEAIRQALATHQQLAAGPADNLPGLGENVFWGWHSLAGIIRGQGRDREAESAYRDALKEAEKLRAASPHGATARCLLAGARRELGSLLCDLGRRNEGSELLAQAVAGSREVMNELPGVPFYGAEAGLAEMAQGDFLRGEGRIDEAEKAFHRALDCFEKAARSLPGAPDRRRDRARAAVCWDVRGELLRRTGRFRQAEEALRRGLALHQRLFDETGEAGEERGLLARSHQNLAWVLAIRPDRQPHHAADALEHARKAVELEPDPDRWHTLGVAHCRLGHWEEALAAMAKSRQLQPDPPHPPSSFSLFFEAMAYHGQGDRDKARRCYDEGVRWMEENLPDHADLRRFRTEAAQVLRVGAGP